MSAYAAAVALALALAAPAVAFAQPSPAADPAHAPPSPSTDPAVALRAANEALAAGDWTRVDVLARAVLGGHPRRAEAAEGHRLAGLAAYFEGKYDVAERELVAYLRLDPDGKLDPAVVPPDAVSFFVGVHDRHATELAALRPRPRHLSLAFVPPLGQFQSGERTKGWVLLGMFSAFAAADLTSVGLLAHWCHAVSGPAGGSLECLPAHLHGSETAREVEIATTAALIVTYVYGVYDGVSEYRRQRAVTIAPYATPRDDGAVLGVAGRF